MNKLILVIIILCLFYSCEKESSNCFFANGSIEKKEIVLDDFTSIEVYDIFNMILIQDTVNRIVLEGGENLLQHVEIRIKDDTLKISHSIRCIWLREYEKINIYVYFSRLDRIVADAPVRIISSDTLTCSNLEYFALGEIGEADMILNCNYFRFDGSYSTLGQFRFKGKSDKSRFYVNYGSSVFADSLISGQADVYFKTIGDIHVHVTEHLRVWIWGPGNVYYSGNPGKVEIMEKRSTGRLIKVD